MAEKRDRSGPVLPDDEVPIPRWVVEGLEDYLRGTFREFRTGRGGRHTYWRERYRQDRIDFARYDAVHSFHLNRGLTWEDAYSAAAEHLTGQAAGQPRAIKESYLRVTKALKRGELGRYYIPKSIKVTGLD